MNVGLTLDDAALEQIAERAAARAHGDRQRARSQNLGRLSGAEPIPAIDDIAGKRIPAIDRLAVRNPLVAGADSERGR